ncbi:hypothetical protein [Rhodoferax sp.]|uniref:hypothetical protein n=1 Tax=Rhodoferax sp. TaxID=50421 RepID=UPI002731C1AF|nr:hypothetical protein [Rhodoferax sp.]MDP1527878.1 hypothetical protein [Rhodoferax sp.]MDP1944509.1 hypothetical protein [Rhodoferax sp.]MDP2440157.1 hypothetical protein [Rhodoferax sp.]MDZ4208867.1 hypothetical protein [Rhodoferax sp.]
MVATLSSVEKASLVKADRIPVVNALASLVLPSANGWFPAMHVAMHGIVKDHKPTGSSPISPNALAEYLAIATPTHCADGWSYLSRALYSYLLGDAHSAWHFAYYAELRAAQSILSSLGCGAFNNWNCVLDSSGQMHTTGSHPTHTMVWLALQHLAENSPSAGAAIAAATRILGSTLPEIVQYAYPGKAPTTTSSNWICEWLFDLETGADDKGFRNRCSYNPHIATPHRAQLIEGIELVSALWEVLEPSPKAAFLELDKQILRLALKKEGRDSLTLRTGGVPPDDAALEAELLAAHARILASAPTFDAISAGYISDTRSPDHPILFHARNDSSTPETPRPVLARATLLLRIATGMSQNLLVDAAQDANINFWLDELAVRQGVVADRSQLPTDRAELYLDCAVAVEDIERKFNSGATSLAELSNYREVKPALVTQAERVVQWGLAS